MSDEKPNIPDLIEESSLGTEGARLLRRRAATSDVASVVEAASTSLDELVEDAGVQLKRGAGTADVASSATEADSEARKALRVPLADTDNQEHYAVDALLRRIHPLVTRYCRARIGRQERTFVSAEEVAQEVCLAVLKALPSFREQGRPFLAFVFGIAAHKVADAHRAAQNRAGPLSDIPDEPVQGGGPEQRALQAELAGRMGRLLDMLPDKQREIIVLRMVVGLSVEETAEVVGATSGAVRVAQHRALARLRKVLSPEGIV